jgi:hypothetical protein
MKRLKLLLAFALFPPVSCDDDNSERPDIDFGEFTMEVPEMWQHETLQGYDSKKVTIRRLPNLLHNAART